MSDAFVRSAPVFRGGSIWYSQSIALPAGGLTVNSRGAMQWTRIDTAGVFVDGARVEDATATLNNGGPHYSWGSLSVNDQLDLLVC